MGLCMTFSAIFVQLPFVHVLMTGETRIFLQIRENILAHMMTWFYREYVLGWRMTGFAFDLGMGTLQRVFGLIVIKRQPLHPIFRRVAFLAALL